MVNQEPENKDSKQQPKSDKLSDAERARRRFRHKIKEARRLMEQRFDELEAEVEKLKTETAG